MTTIGTSARAEAKGRLLEMLLKIDVADELVVGDQPRGDVVAEGEREGEDRAGDDGREGERQDHPAEGGEAARRRGPRRR